MSVNNLLDLLGILLTAFIAETLALVCLAHSLGVAQGELRQIEKNRAHVQAHAQMGVKQG